jgi:quinol-cytochrome oxidoreductase complex cytochrome b subunit
MTALDGGGHERRVWDHSDEELQSTDGVPTSDSPNPAQSVHDDAPGGGIGADARGPKTAPFFSDSFISECTSVVLLLCLYSALCIFFPTALGVRANPAVMLEGSKPAWYFLFLYEYVRLVPSFVGALTPALLLLLVGAWPFLDRNPSRDPRKRVLALCLAVLTVVGILTFTYLGWVA